jgi:hypothetical protein
MKGEEFDDIDEQEANFQQQDDERHGESFKSSKQTITFHPKKSSDLFNFSKVRAGPGLFRGPGTKFSFSTSNLAKDFPKSFIHPGP